MNYSQTTKRSYDFLHDVKKKKKNTICPITYLHFEGDLKWGTKRKFAKNPQYIRAWTAGDWGGKEDAP